MFLYWLCCTSLGGINVIKSLDFQLKSYYNANDKGYKDKNDGNCTWTTVY